MGFFQKPIFWWSLLDMLPFWQERAAKNHMLSTHILTNKWFLSSINHHLIPIYISRMYEWFHMKLGMLHPLKFLILGYDWLWKPVTTHVPLPFYRRACDHGQLRARSVAKWRRRGSDCPARGQRWLIFFGEGQRWPPWVWNHAIYRIHAKGVIHIIYNIYLRYRNLISWGSIQHGSIYTSQPQESNQQGNK